MKHDSETVFLLEEYKALRSQIEIYIAHIHIIERWALIFSGAVWAWLSGGTHPSVPAMAYFVPALITCILGWRAIGLHKSNINVGTYVRRIEDRLVDASMGWEKYLGKQIPLMYRSSIYWLWIALIVSNIGIGTTFLFSVQGR